MYLTSFSDSKSLLTGSKSNLSSRCLCVCKKVNGLNLVCFYCCSQPGFYFLATDLFSVVVVAGFLKKKWIMVMTFGNNNRISRVSGGVSFKIFKILLKWLAFSWKPCLKTWSSVSKAAVFTSLTYFKLTQLPSVIFIFKQVYERKYSWST